MHRKVGFIGLGQMGYPMASNLLKKMQISEFYVNDYVEDVARAFQQEHPSAKIASTPLDIAQKCSIIVTMLPAAPQVKSVYLGERGLLKGIQANSMIIDSSTIDPSTVKEVARAIHSKSSFFLDAPVSGGLLCLRPLIEKRYSWSKRWNFDLYGWCRN